MGTSAHTVRRVLARPVGLIGLLGVLLGSTLTLVVGGAAPASATVVTAPMVIAFLFARRLFIRGITMTGVKG